MSSLPENKSAPLSSATVNQSGNQKYLGVGIVEGFYGKPWTNADRSLAADRLAELGGRFYIYAPKGDPYLRKQWTEKLPEASVKALKKFGNELKVKNLEFGVGLSPYELYRSFDLAAKRALETKIREIESLGVTHLALLFDDMRGDLPNLAALQIEIIRFVQSLSAFPTLSFCPTYYTTDPILDKVFGQRPEGYLEKLATEVDPSVHFFWTGEKVCSKDYPAEHLAEVTKLLGRKPFLWDNYPVNDGEKMSKHLHLREMSGREPRLIHELSGHAINPMNEARLSWIPMRTLFQTHAGQVMNWMSAAVEELGPDFAKILSEDLVSFQDDGLAKFTDEQKTAFIKRYRDLNHPAAFEIIAWLSGDYQVTRELVLTQ
jgi:hyaluronoglucosaminidase